MGIQQIVEGLWPTEKVVLIVIIKVRTSNKAVPLFLSPEHRTQGLPLAKPRHVSEQRSRYIVVKI